MWTSNVDRFMIHVAVVLGAFWFCFFAAHWVNFGIQGQGRANKIGKYGPYETVTSSGHVPLSCPGKQKQKRS